MAIRGANAGEAVPSHTERLNGLYAAHWSGKGHRSTAIIQGQPIEIITSPLNRLRKIDTRSVGTFKDVRNPFRKPSVAL